MLFFLTHPNRNANINVVLGANEELLDTNIHKIISTSSCNATVLLLKLIDSKKDIMWRCGYYSSSLNHQRVLDGNFVGSATRV